MMGSTLLIDHFKKAPAPLIVPFFQQLGNSANRVPVADTAFLILLSIREDPGESEIHVNWTRDLWAARVSHEGKRTAVYGKTKEEARQKLRSLQRKQDENLPLVTSQTPIKQNLEQWLENIRHQVRAKTWVDYEVAVRLHIVPYLGHVPLGKLSPDHVQKAWSNLLKAGRSASVVQYAHLRLSKALNDAMEGIPAVEGTLK